VSFIVHATENLERVSKEVFGRLGAEGVPTFDRMEGHFGNKLVLVKLHLTGGEAEDAFLLVGREMGIGSWAKLGEQFRERIDEHKAVYLRLDKQELMRGRFAFAERDPVLLKVKPRGFLGKGDATEFYLSLLRGDSG
jgi:RNA binding exosome subunit